MLSRFFPYIYLGILFFGATLLHADGQEEAPKHSISSTKSEKKPSIKETQRLIKEVKATEQQLKKNQEQLERILKRLIPYEEVSERLKPERSSILLMHLELFSFQIKRVIHNFFLGAEHTLRLVFAPGFRSGSGWVVMWMSSIFLLSCLGHIVLYQRFLSRLWAPLRKNTLIGVRSLTVLSIPIMVYGCFGWVWSLKQWFLPPLCTQFLAYLPLYTYVLIAGYRCVEFYFTSGISQQFNAQSVQIVSQAFQKSCIIYFLTRVFKEILTLTSADELVFSTFAQSSAIIFSFSVWSALQKFKYMVGAEVSVLTQKNRLTLLLSVFQWAVGWFAGLWLLFPDVFMAFFIPTLVTVVVLLSVSALQPRAYRFFLEFLWKRKQKSFLFPFLYQYRRSVLKITKTVLYVGLLTLWGEVFQEIQHTTIFSLVYWITPIFSSPWVTRCGNAALVGVTSFLFIKLIHKFLRYYVEDRYSVQSVENNFLFTRLKTMMAIIRTVVNVFVGGPALIFMISHIFDVPLKEWAASVGVAGFGLTFGLQNVVRDFITGFFIIFENNLMVGDEVDIDGRGGKVEAITVRTVKIRSENGMLTTIPFGNIVAIGNRNKYFSAVLMNISVCYAEDLDKVQKLVEKAFFILKKNSSVKRYVLGNLEFRGVNEVTPYSVVLLAKIRTTPNCQDQVRRQFNRILKELFDDAGVQIPNPPQIMLRNPPSLTNTSV